ncbi:hypothetical protein [Salinivibrio costicola]|uniref:NYN domain-containing protein n=1 Tax=Salinivibrio costicola TaxID=51367 RepID=A0ABX6K9N7_SALCS|nr:hypothetical protein [Salinivibrio costicola]QIR07982.1 hypothetical protein HBA18_16265 [Salinivibrio costicola]
MSRRTVAIFVDAGFFNRIFTSAVDPEMKMVPEEFAKKMWHYWIKHVDNSFPRSCVGMYMDFESWAGFAKRSPNCT